MATISNDVKKEKSGLTNTEKAIIGVSAGEGLWKYKKQTAWLLRNTWKLGSKLARRNPYAFALVAAVGALSTDFSQSHIVSAWNDIEKSVGKQYKSVHDWVLDVQKDPNVANASADILNRALPDGVFTGLPPDVINAIPEKVRNVLSNRKGTKPQDDMVPKRVVLTPTTAEERNIELVYRVGILFGSRDVEGIHDSLMAFMALTPEAVHSAASILSITR
jgi:hypothetical protein